MLRSELNNIKSKISELSERVVEIELALGKSPLALWSIEPIVSELESLEVQLIASYKQARREELNVKVMPTSNV